MYPTWNVGVSFCPLAPYSGVVPLATNEAQEKIVAKERGCGRTVHKISRARQAFSRVTIADIERFRLPLISTTSKAGSHSYRMASRLVLCLLIS